MVIIKNTEAKCIIEIKICTKKRSCEQEKIVNKPASITNRFRDQQKRPVNQI